MADRGVEASIVRGGTSKGVFLELAALPAERVERDAFVLALMGSPDPMQIDGLGGTHSSTSKVVAVGPSEQLGIDVDYLFLQVGIDEAVVDDSGNCGNLSIAVAPWAVESGLVDASAGSGLMMRNLNTGRVLRSRIESDAPQPVEGRGLAVRVAVDHLDPGGAVSGRVLPTGSDRDEWVVDGRAIVVSLVDVTSPVVMVRAAEVGLTGIESREDLSSRTDVLSVLEQLRERAAAACGLVGGASANPAVPRVALLSPGADGTDVMTRNLSLQRVHHAVPATTAMCVAAASTIPGTVAHEVAGSVPDRTIVRVGHLKGVVDVRVEAGDPIASVGVTGTARTLMTGTAYPGGKS